MARAREQILKRGGAAAANVFTRIQLALYGELSWNAIPTMPVELILLPRWFPVHLSRMSYWARTVIVPLLVLQVLKPMAANKRGVHVPEIFGPPVDVGAAPHQKRLWAAFFHGLDKVLKAGNGLWPKTLRARAIKACVDFTEERLNGEDGLGAIYPAMANSVMMFAALGRPESDPSRAIARQSVEKLLVVKDDEAYCQPCVSPVWDTALAAHALLEVGTPETETAALNGLDWLLPLQELEVKGDWAERKPDVRPGGWAFQYRNAHYPDLDDTAVVVMALDRAKRGERRCRSHRARHRMDRRPAVRKRRLGRLRRRQHRPLSQQHPLRRSWRPARPADRRCLGALHLDARPARRARGFAAHAGRHRLCARRPDGRWLVVRPLGRQLHLRHLVGALRAQRRRGRPAVRTRAPRGELARIHPEPRWRLGRGLRKLRPRLSAATAPPPRAPRRPAGR